MIHRSVEFEAEKKNRTPHKIKLNFKVLVEKVGSGSENYAPFVDIFDFSHVRMSYTRSEQTSYGKRKRYVMATVYLQWNERSFHVGV